MFQHAKVFCKMWTRAVKIQAYVQEVNIISRYINIYQDATSTYLFRHRYKYLPKYIPLLFEWCVCYVSIMMQIIFRREHLSNIQIYFFKNIHSCFLRHSHVFVSKQKHTLRVQTVCPNKDKTIIQTSKYSIVIYMLTLVT